MVKKYIKLPVEIEAIQYKGLDNIQECLEFAELNDRYKGNPLFKDYAFKIPTLEGEHICSIGDFIIKGVQGEFYPCKPDIFAKTYKEV